MYSHHYYMLLRYLVIMLLLPGVETCCASELDTSIEQ